MTADSTETVAAPAFTMLGSDSAEACVGDSCLISPPETDLSVDE